jgi:hypothetical protein
MLGLEGHYQERSSNLLKSNRAKKLNREIMGSQPPSCPNGHRTWAGTHSSNPKTIVQGRREGRAQVRLTFLRGRIIR